MPSTVLITGATGLIGSHAAETFVAAGWRVNALVRATSDPTFLKKLGVSLRQGDITDHASLPAACKGAEVVVHCAAKLGEWDPRAEFQAMNVAGVKAIVEAAASAGCRRVVHVSSVAVYGREARQEIVEDTPYRPTGHPYMDTKAEGERAARDVAEESGIEVAIVRPCLVYGPRDRTFLPHIIKNLKRGRMVIVGSGSHRANTVFVGTVADMCLALATHDRAAGEAFNVADPDPLTWRELLTAIALRVGARPPQMAVPVGICYAVGGLMEMAARAIGSPKPPPMTRFVAGALGFDLSYSTKKAEKLLGFRPAIGVRAGLERSIVEPAAA